MSIKISLLRTFKFYNGDYYQDILYGGYQYIENGVEKINTLSDTSKYNAVYDTHIYGHWLYDSCTPLPSEDCVEGEDRLNLMLIDPHSTAHIADLFFSKRTVNGQEALKAVIVFDYLEDLNEGESTPDPTMFWQGEFTFIKQ